MDSSNKTIRVNIGGDDYCIKADVDQKTTMKIAEFVDQKIMELKKQSSIYDNLTLAVLSALNIAGERYEYKEKFEKIQEKFHSIKERSSSIGEKIDISIKNK